MRKTTKTFQPFYILLKKLIAGDAKAGFRIYFATKEKG